MRNLVAVQQLSHGPRRGRPSITVDLGLPDPPTLEPGSAGHERGQNQVGDVVAVAAQVDQVGVRQIDDLGLADDPAPQDRSGTTEHRNVTDEGSGVDHSYDAITRWCSLEQLH